LTSGTPSMKEWWESSEKEEKAPKGVDDICWSFIKGYLGTGSPEVRASETGRAALKSTDARVSFFSGALPTLAVWTGERRAEEKRLGALLVVLHPWLGRGGKKNQENISSSCRPGKSPGVGTSGYRK